MVSCDVNHFQSILGDRAVSVEIVVVQSYGKESLQGVFECMIQGEN